MALECKGMDECRATGGVRIPLEENRRIFTPLARSSYKSATYYRKRTAVERGNSRLDEAYGFEKHFIRGKQKMELLCALALMVLRAMAVARIREKQGINWYTSLQVGLFKHDQAQYRTAFFGELAKNA